MLLSPRNDGTGRPLVARALVSLDCAFPGIWQFVGQTGSDSDGELVCFAGRSHGELMVEQSKLVGLSQRRTRDGARVQGQLHFVDPTDEILALLVEEARDRFEGLRLLMSRVEMCSTTGP